MMKRKPQLSMFTSGKICFFCKLTVRHFPICSSLFALVWLFLWMLNASHILAISKAHWSALPCCVTFEAGGSNNPPFYDKYPQHSEHIFSWYEPEKNDYTNNIYIYIYTYMYIYLTIWTCMKIYGNRCEWVQFFVNKCELFFTLIESLLKSVDILPFVTLLAICYPCFAFWQLCLVSEF